MSGPGPGGSPPIRMDMPRSRQPSRDIGPDVVGLGAELAALQAENKQLRQLADAVGKYSEAVGVDYHVRLASKPKGTDAVYDAEYEMFVALDGLTTASAPAAPDAVERNVPKPNCKRPDHAWVLQRRGVVHFKDHGRQRDTTEDIVEWACPDCEEDRRHD